MKIKKVEIQAFRAYDKVEDCTFDFQTKNGSYADFVSIYAPNGFGKTSFYDAVEWAITNNIYRFVRHTINKEYAQDEKNLKYEIEGSKSPQYILRHKYSLVDLPGFVKVFLSNPDGEKIRPVPLAAQINSRDYDFEDRKSENIYFRKVILSQDSIDSFLKEDKPEVRYQKFVEFFGNKELDVCYTNIINLIKANENKISYFEKQISNYRKEIPTINDDEILAKVNAKIDELILKNENLTPVESNFSDTDFLHFSDKISENKLNVLTKINNNQKNLNELKSKRSELESYFFAKESITRYEENLLNLKNIKSDFIKISEFNNQINSKTKSVEEKINILFSIEGIKNTLPNYYKINENIIRGRKQLEADNLIFNARLSASRSIQIEIVNLKSKSDNIYNSVHDLENKLNDSLDLENFIQENQNEINNHTEKINQFSKLLIELDKDISDLTLRNRSIEFEITQIKNNEIPNSVKTDNNFNLVFSQIEERNKFLLAQKNKLKELDIKVSKYTALSDEISQLALLAIKIIDRDLDANCPTCGYSYDSYSELINKIKNNSILEEEYLSLITESNLIRHTIEEIESNISLLKQNIISIKEDLYSKYRNEILSKQQYKNEQTDIDNLNKKRLSYFEILKKEQILKLEGLSVIEYQKKINDLLLKLQIEADTNAKDLLAKQESERVLENDISVFRKTLGLLEAEINSLEASKDFVKVNKFASRNISLNLGNEESINKLIAEKQLEIDNESMIIKELRESQASYIVKVSKYNESVIDSEIQLIEELMNRTKTDLSAFTQFIVSRFSNNYVSYDFDQLDTYFSELITGTSIAIAKLAELLTDYQKIEEYKDNVLPFLKLRSIQSSIEDIEDKIIYQKKIGKKFTLEKESLSTYINHQIESFFYEDLINKLYKKIDPHPEYKTIVFKCDFSGDVPKLNVFVNGDGKEHLIPNLYFSSAQMNILSLSIFLAKAINAKDDLDQPIDCIFIDDPIQSMDSINILSTIDLLRSISLNLNKQIILSTHDEHFHKLLKRKMPPNKFNSKFIELETFGKVKNSEE